LLLRARIANAILQHSSPCTKYVCFTACVQLCMAVAQWL
jgi:hypothetical protein